MTKLIYTYRSSSQPENKIKIDDKAIEVRGKYIYPDQTIAIGKMVQNVDLQRKVRLKMYHPCTSIWH